MLSSSVWIVTITLLHQSKPVLGWVRNPAYRSYAARSIMLAATEGKTSVAVIGGGIAGLSCANELASRNRFEVTVFDTGRLRPGGRCSSRQIGDPPGEKDQQHTPLLSKYTIDHAAQILAVVPGKFPAFDKQIDYFEKTGVIKEFPKGTVCFISTKKYQPSTNGKQNGNKNEPKSEEFVLRPINNGKKGSPKMYYGSKGMGSVPMALSDTSNGRDTKSFSLQQDIWVSPSSGIRYQKQTNKWKVQANGQSLGIFDKLVIAHNGKCADRIMSKSPAKDLHSLLRVNFAPSVPRHGGKKMTLNSIYSLVLAVPKDSFLSKALPQDKFVTGLVQNEPTLKLISSNNRKYPNDSDDEIEVWTVLSSPTFAKKYKAPQENLPPETIANVTKLMLEAVERSLNIPESNFAEQVVESRLQLWGAATPLNVWDSSSSSSESQQNNGFIFDAEHGVGACGDWLLEPSIAGAWESGRRLAEFLSSGEDQSVGLPPHGKFQASDGARKAGIGALQ